MSLSCNTGDGDYSDCEWVWSAPEGFTETAIEGPRKRCKSCRSLIKHGSDAVHIQRSREIRSDIEERIYGCDGEVSLAPYWMCEECGGLLLSLLEHGYSLDIEDDMRELVKEHAALVRIVGDAPCRQALLDHDLSWVHKGAFVKPTRVAFRQIDVKSGSFGKPPILQITCVVPSLEALEAQWKMAREAHPLPSENHEWRILDLGSWSLDNVGVERYEEVKL